ETRPVPASSNRPVTGLIDHRVMVVFGGKPLRFGKDIGAGCMKTMSPGSTVTTRSGVRFDGRAAGVKEGGTSVMPSGPRYGLPPWSVSVPAATSTAAPGMAG